MKKPIATLAIALALTGFGTVTAQAYSSPETATASDPVVAPGEQFIFSGTGMNPNEQVNITASNEASPAAAGNNGSGIGSTSVPVKIAVLAAVLNFSTVADSNGTFSIPITLTEPGTYTLTATGAISGTTVTAVVTVVDTAIAGDADSGSDLAKTGGTRLADTGSDASLLLWGAAGIGALGLGAGSVIVARRRSKIEA